MPIPFPRIRLLEFREHRLRKSIVGSLLDEQVDIPFTERITAQLQKWQDKGGSVSFSSAVSVKFGDVLDQSDARVVTMAYSASYIDNNEFASIVYGM